MSLDASIVVVNEYTVRLPNGRGTRGSTPGSYVADYVARKGACEDVTPVRLFDADSYVRRYMARSEAVESMQEQDVPKLSRKIADTQKKGGVAFGYGSLSLSDEGLKAVSKDVQRQFDNGHTIFKTVISFDEEYLRECGVIDPDFVFKKRGDYRGNIDQMKLRMAIANGVRKISSDFDDLQFVAAIQVDTAHVHAHLAMVDRGHGVRGPDGRQVGILNSRQKRLMRRGIDMSLDEQKSVQKMSSSVSFSRRNALCFIKKFTHRAMEQDGLPQFLIACLPADRRLWRASSNSRFMRKPNAILREYVMQVLDDDGSGYKEALRSVMDYALVRREREGLSAKEYRKLIDNGRERIISDCMNGVYGILKDIPDGRLSVRTPMLDAMSMDYDSMVEHAASDPMVEFGFKLRSYSTRLSFHKKERKKFHEAVVSMESSDMSEDAVPLLDYFKFEESYNEMLMCKYQHFLSFLPPSDMFEDEFKDLMDYRTRMERLVQLSNDRSARRMLPDSAEDYGQRVYGMHGGRYAATMPGVLEARAAKMHDTYERMEDAFIQKLSEHGLVFDGHGVKKGMLYAFDDVKQLDLHHMQYDFPYDAPVSKYNVDVFTAAAARRRQLYDAAADYLTKSGQDGYLKNLPGRDVMLMHDVAQSMQANAVLGLNRPDAAFSHDGRTVRLSPEYGEAMKLAVRAAVQSVQLE